MLISKRLLESPWGAVRMESFDGTKVTEGSGGADPGESNELGEVDVVRLEDGGKEMYRPDTLNSNSRIAGGSQAQNRRSQ